jgi:hypothetical protein
MTSMDDVVTFLCARLGERELMLRTVSPVQMAWATFLHADGSMRYTSVVSANSDVWVCDGHAVEPDSVQVVFDRDQEMADVAAKRQILAMHKRTATRAGDRLIEHCSCQDDWSTIFGRYWPCDTLSLLALPYAGHPDYREEWKP